jgi:hypothetical protein
MTAVTSDSCQVEFDFRFGWCRMRLDVAGISATYRATSIVDSFGALAYAVATVAAGAMTASALWGDEPGGVFLDLSTSGPHYVGLVVAGLDSPGWITPESPPWTPVRGAVLTNAIIPREVALRAFHTGFTSALHRGAGRDRRDNGSGPRTGPGRPDTEARLTPVTTEEGQVWRYEYDAAAEPGCGKATSPDPQWTTRTTRPARSWQSSRS